MQEMEKRRNIPEFYQDFVGRSKSVLEERLSGLSGDESYDVRRNLNVCIKNYRLVSAVTDKIVNSRASRDMIEKLKIEYKYHNQDMIESAYKKTISYVERLYYGLAEDFIKNMNLAGSYEDIYNAECELNSMMFSFMSSYTQIHDKKYVPVIDITI